MIVANNSDQNGGEKIFGERREKTRKYLESSINADLCTWTTVE